MPEAVCYHCGSGKSAFYAEENGFTLVKCAGCGLLYLENRPADHEISKAHQQGRHSGIRELDVTGRFNRAAIGRYRRTLDRVYRGRPGASGRWLDVGCGHGEFITAVRQWSGGKIVPQGSEPNVRKQESARKRGLDVHFIDIETEAERYDTISLLNVFSHLPDPPGFFRSLKKLLNSGGEILLETGDTAHFTAADHYRPFYLPDHLSFASEEIVTEMLNRLDFDIVSVVKFPYVRADLKSFTREALKMFLPQFDSRLRYYLKWKLYSRTDMFIRAKLKG